MTSIYSLRSDANRFQAYIHGSEKDMHMLSAVAGTPLSKGWAPPCLVKEGAEAPRGDCPCIFQGSSVPCLSERAIKALHSLLVGVGEVLPAQCDDEALFIYNCTRLAYVVDLDSSDIEWEETGNMLWADTLSWKPEAYSETLFRLPQIHNSPTFMTETVRVAIEEAGLEGFLFEEVTRI